MNNVALMGRLTADAELKATQSGLEVSSFCIAINRPTAKDAEKQADFINCVAWRQTASFISNYFHKGDMIAVEGSLQSRKWTDKDGKNRVSYEVVVNRAHFCGSKKDSASGGGGYAAPGGYAPGNYAAGNYAGSKPTPGGPDGMDELGEGEDLPF